MCVASKYAASIAIPRLRIVRLEECNEDSPLGWLSLAEVVILCHRIETIMFFLLDVLAMHSPIA
jgi:hypothetical protein